MTKRWNFLRTVLCTASHLMELNKRSPRSKTQRWPVTLEEPTVASALRRPGVS